MERPPIPQASLLAGFILKMEATTSNYDKLIGEQ